MTSQPTSWHSMSDAEVLKRLAVDPDRGLALEEAAQRLGTYGRNAFPAGEKKTLLGLFFGQFKDFLVLILVAAAVISFAVAFVNPEEGFTDAVAILAILILNAMLGVSQERKADRALDALKRMAVPVCEVTRNGRLTDLSSEEIVPGDIVALREGDFIAADMRLIEAPNLRVDEASLTGESAPVEKRLTALAPDAPLAERFNMAYAGAHVVYGRGRGVVVATGMQREVGRIAEMLGRQEAEETPLQRNLAGLGKLLGIGATVICALVFLVGILEGEKVFSMFMTAVSLAVAAIPEGLPAVVTIVLALGVYRMSRFNALIRKLPAVETLGCASYICTDKTGTLTQNRMTVIQAITSVGLFSGHGPQGAQFDLIRISVLCNDSRIQRTGEQEERFGDPTELAFLDYAEKQGADVADVRRQHPRAHEVPFDSQRKRMSTLHTVNGQRRILVKGAPGSVLERCTQYEAGGRLAPLTDADRRRALEAVDQMAGQALRVLGFAWKETQGKDVISQEDECDLVFSGLMGMMDPARPEVRDAIRDAKNAGIKAIMITGDDPLTARAVAQDVGLLEPGDEVITGPELEKMSEEELQRRIRSLRVFARVWPEQKMKIVQALQASGEVVAMTGDGVNDAPALKKADIGVAMGITGTEVAKETSDMVLADDNFATIVHAVKEGRVIFDNIRKCVMYLLACNVGEIFAVFVPIVAGLGSPFRPVQILLVNLVTDGAPALSLGVNPPDPDIMKRKPRQAKPGMLSAVDMAFVLYNALFIATAVVLSYVIGLAMSRELGLDAEKARAGAMTMAFVTLAVDELWRVFCFRSQSRNFWQVNFFENKYLVLATVSSALIVVLSVVIEPLAKFLGNESLTLRQWGVALLLSLMPFAAVEAWTCTRRLVLRR